MHAALTVACLCLGDAFQGPPRLAPRRALRADGRNAAVAAVEAERRPLAARARTLFRFTRPHTFVGTAVAVPALHAYAAASAAALLSRACARSVASALAPALLMNVFITGLNQLCDVDIDRVNKPHLPVASGELSVHHARLVVGACLVAALALGRRSSAPVQRVLAGSAALGAAYSAPPLRLKRSPLLAALSIVVVRGVLVNACFYAHARANLAPRARAAAAARLPLVVAFFSLLGVAIALMKDVPDTQGDTTFGVATYARRGGRPRVFALASGLLGGTLGAGALALGVAAARAAAPRRPRAWPSARRSAAWRSTRGGARRASTPAPARRSPTSTCTCGSASSRATRCCPLCADGRASRRVAYPSHLFIYLNSSRV